MDDYRPGYFVELDSYEARAEYEEWLDGVHRGRRVSDEEAQDRYDEAMRYLDNQKN